MPKFKKKRKGARNLSDWMQQVVLRPSQIEMVVLAELKSLLQRFEPKYFNLSSRSHDPVWLDQYRLEMEAYVAWLGVLQQLLQGVPLEKITVPELLPGPKVAESKVPDELWLDFGLTQKQWEMSIHDLLLRSPDRGAVAASNALSRAGIKTVGDFYGAFNGDEVKVSSGFIRNFGRKRLQVVKQVFKEANIPWPKASAMTTKSDLGGDKPWEFFGLTRKQWTVSLESLQKLAKGGDEIRALNALRRGGIKTVSQLYSLWQGADTNLFSVRNIGSNRVAALRAVLARAGIHTPPPSG